MFNSSLAQTMTQYTAVDIGSPLCFLFLICSEIQTTCKIIGQWHIYLLTDTVRSQISLGRVSNLERNLSWITCYLIGHSCLMSQQIEMF